MPGSNIRGVSTSERVRSPAARRLRVALGDVGEHVLEARLAAGVSQEEVGRLTGLSGTKIGRIERIALDSLTIADAMLVSTALGLDLSVRTYPGGSPLRDAGQARRLSQLLAHVGPPLTFRTDVPLPQSPDRPRDQRAWDAVVYGHGERTGVELEARVRDAQSMTRRHELKRRDDPVEHFLLVLADTRTNRRVLDEYRDLLAHLPRLRTSNVLRGLQRGEHPPTGLILM